MKSVCSSVKKPVTDSNPYTLYSEKEDFTGTMDELKQECQGTWFQDKRLADKEDVLYVARRMKAFWETYPDDFTEEYCRHAADLFGEFIHIAESKVIFPAPDGLWTYSVLMRGTGILLELDHYPEVPVAGEELQISGDVDEPGKTEEKKKSRKRELRISPPYQEKTDERYTLFSAKAKLVTAEEYARLNDLEHVAAVTRIRRGKIRSAVKVGKQWRIPDLAAPIERGYQAAAYGWDGKLSGLPVTYRVFEEYQRVDIYQDPVQHQFFHIRMTKDDGSGVEFKCERGQRDKIEQALIAHPDIKCLSDEIMRISFKDEECRIQKG